MSQDCIAEQQVLQHNLDELQHIPKKTRFCHKYFDISYDITAGLISIFDITTDIWILIQWYYQDRMVFFGISLTILILANFATSILFYTRVGDPEPFGLLCAGCCLIPFGPLLSFLIYFGDNCFTSKHVPSGSPSQSRKWMENKLSNHIGFLLEAIMEAFPQCILQMIAIIYFHELQIIAIVSIIMSMISISSKSLIISAAMSINIKTMIFTWFYAVSDFFSIFFVLSFVFYGGNEIHSNSITILRNIWLYKIYIFTVPTCLLCSIPIFIWGFYELTWNLGWRRSDWSCNDCCNSKWCKILIIFIDLLILLPLWTIGMIMGIMILEVLCYAYIAFIIYKLGHGRIPHSNESADVWLGIINWIKKKGYIVQRLCCVNRQLLLMRNDDKILNDYLEKKEHLTQYQDVTYGSIKKLYNNLLWERFSDRFIFNTNNGIPIMDICINLVVWFYMISRILTLIFPILVIIIISINEQSIIYDLPLFQMIMLFIMLAMILIMIILFCIILREEKIIFYILPSLKARLYAGIEDYLLLMITSYHERLIIKPFIKNVLCESIFGNDIGLLIYAFMPFGLEEEEHAIKLKQKASQYTHISASDMPYSVQYAMFNRRAF